MNSNIFLTIFINNYFYFIICHNSYLFLCNIWSAFVGSSNRTGKRLLFYNDYCKRAQDAITIQQPTIYSFHFSLEIGFSSHLLIPSLLRILRVFVTVLIWNSDGSFPVLSVIAALSRKTIAKYTHTHVFYIWCPLFSAIIQPQLWWNIRFFALSTPNLLLPLSDL